MDHFHDLNPVMKSMLLFTGVLWKLYMGYYLYGVLGGAHGHGHAVAGVINGDGIAANASAGAGFSGMYDSMGKPMLANRLGNRHFQTDFIPLTATTDADADAEEAKQQPNAALIPSTSASTPDKPIRVLHIVTALAEYNNGSRGTEHGEDRLQKVFLPILKNSVESMIAAPYNYQVDVFLVLGWKLLPERKKLIEDALPEGVGLQIWDDAVPLGYDRPRTDVKLKPVTRGLARCHRFVIKDKLMHYDLFSVFEDDMRITGGHIHHYLEVSRELERLVEEAPDVLPVEIEHPHTQQTIKGGMTKKQLKRLMPGFIRAEVLIDESLYPSQKALDPVPIDFEFVTEDGSTEEKIFDPVPCCHVPNGLGKLPPNPRGDQIMIWETAVKGAVVREMPKGASSMLDWVMLQPGPKSLERDEFIGGYWSGNLGLYKDEDKPGAGDPRLIAQQGGWMATREQIVEMHLNQCGYGMLPPYEDGGFNQDGLTLNNVEFWSGGFSIFSGTRAGCNMQRVISLKPEHFSHHFLYHTANNKQKSLPNFRLLKTNNFMGQINTVVKAAKAKASAQ